MRAGNDNDLTSWKMAISAAERYLERYSDCRSFINECITCATGGKGSPTIKEYVINKALWKSAGPPVPGSVHYVPATLFLSKTSKTIESINKSCASKDNGICVTPEFARQKLCPKVTDVTQGFFRQMLANKGAAFKHLIENGGEKESTTRWNESMTGPTCEFGIRVEGLYRGSTINKWYWLGSNTYVPRKERNGEYLLR